VTLYSPKIPCLDHDELEAQPYPVVAFARDYPRGHLIERHRHVRAQLIYATRGIMRIDTPDGIWVVPPLRAVWVPPSVDHEIGVSSTACLRTLLIEPTARISLPRECCVVEVSGLLRELILRVVALAEKSSTPPDHMVELILDEIRQVRVLPVHIPLPHDARALKVCQGILQNPADARTCVQWGGAVGASPRTLERLFLRETGTSFRVWRQQARLLAALVRLAAQVPISVVAVDLGYQSPSAFTAMFKRTLGCPPKEFFQQEDSVAADL
jgi:AraC-like DNA-binding protein